MDYLTNPDTAMKKVIFTILVVFFSFCSFSQNTFMKWFDNFETDTWADQVIVLDDGYVITGICLKDGTNQMFMIKSNLTGGMLWLKYLDYGITERGNWSASAKDTENNFYVAFENSATTNLIKVSSQGVVLWSVKYNDVVHQIKYLDNGELLLAVADDNSVSIYRVDPASGQMIVKSEAITSTSPLMTTAMSLLSDNTIVLSVSKNEWGFPQASSLYYMPFTFGTIYHSQLQYSESIVHRSSSVVNDQLISVGHIGQYAITDNRSYLSRYTSSGDVEFAQLITYPAHMARLITHIINNQGQVIALGEYDDGSAIPGKVLLRCMSTDGDNLWTSLLTMNETASGYDLELANDGGYVATGYTSLNNKYIPMLIKTSSAGQVQTLGITKVDHQNTVTVYPNPGLEQVIFEYDANTTGTIQITDITGQLCAELNITGQRTTFNSTTLKPGVYLYTFKNSETITTGKLLIKH